MVRGWRISHVSPWSTQRKKALPRRLSHISGGCDQKYNAIITIAFCDMIAWTFLCKFIDKLHMNESITSVRFAWHATMRHGRSGQAKTADGDLKAARSCSDTAVVRVTALSVSVEGVTCLSVGDGGAGGVETLGCLWNGNGTRRRGGIGLNRNGRGWDEDGTRLGWRQTSFV